MNGGNRSVPSTHGALHGWQYQLEKRQLEAMYRKNRKMMTMYNSLLSRADVDRLYISRNYGGFPWLKISNVCIKGQSLSKDASKEELLAGSHEDRKCSERLEW